MTDQPQEPVVQDNEPLTPAKIREIEAEFEDFFDLCQHPGFKRLMAVMMQNKANIHNNVFGPKVDGDTYFVLKGQAQVLDLLINFEKIKQAEHQAFTKSLESPDNEANGNELED